MMIAEPCRWKGLGIQSVGTLAALIFTLTAVVVGIIAPHAADLQLAHDAVCAGELDFVFTQVIRAPVFSC